MNKSKSFWANKNVVVTGGHGFLGRHLVRQLKKLNPKKIFIPTRPEYDLRNYQDCLKAFHNSNLIIHLAAHVGGIGYNQKHPAELFDDNVLMVVNCLRAARQCGVEKFVAIGTICEYPKFCPVPFKEENIWNGYPEETNAPYGLAKKMLLVQTKAYKEQYGFNSINILPTNLYGPGDNFDPDSSHVIPSLIRKFLSAKFTKSPTVEVWGTGKATREFLFVEDAARGILKAAEHLNTVEPINLGSGIEVSIKELATKIKKATHYKGLIVWNKSKPDGQPRRKLDNTKAKVLFGFEAKISLETGIKKTIKWFLPIWMKENGFSR